MPADTPPVTTPPKRRSRRWLALALSFVLLLVLLEVSCRIDAFFPLAPFNSTLARRHFVLRQESGADQTLALYSAPDPTGEATSVRPIPHPYFGWTSEREMRGAEEQGRWFETPESETTFDVFVLGGSVAADFGNQSGARLEAALSAEPALAGRRVRVWNNSYGGYKAPQTGNLLVWLLALGHRPDAILLIDGFNEVAIGMTNAHSGMHPLMPSFEFWSGLARGKVVDAHSLDLLVELHTAQRAEQAVARQAVDWGFYHSALLTRITLSRLGAKHLAFQLALARYLEAVQPKDEDAAVRGMTFDKSPEAVATAAVRGWSENARLIEAICRARGMKLVHVLQPTLYDADSKPMTGEERHSAEAPSLWMEGVRLGYPRLRAAGTALASDGVPFSDMTRVFAGTNERTYIDVCHLNPRGCEILAEAVLAEFSRVLR